MQQNPTASYDIIGLGNPVMDMLAYVEESFLARHNLTKGATHLVDRHAVAALCEELGEVRQCSGGSAANTIVALASVGMHTAFCGRIAEDGLGRAFAHDIRAAGVTFDAVPALEGSPTACCVVCVTPDGERTMCVYIGACAEMTPQDVHEKQVSASRMLYVEGYLWDAPQAKEAIGHAITLAKRAKARVAFTLSDVFCVSRHRAEFLELIEADVDVLFANEAEALALAETADMAEALRQLAPLVETLVVTCSEKPALIAQAGKVIEVPGQRVTRVEDATGAGDMFAAGFLHGLLQGAALEDCARRGHVMASHIIQQLGARSQTPLREVLARAAA